MSTPCISCARFTFKGSDKAAEGRGFCQSLTRDVYVHIEKTTLCRNYRGLGEDEAARREAWWANKQQQTNAAKCG